MEFETHCNNLRSRSWHFDDDIKVLIVMWLHDTREYMQREWWKENKYVSKVSVTSSVPVPGVSPDQFISFKSINTLEFGKVGFKNLNW